jgi:peptide deformylase
MELLEYPNPVLGEKSSEVLSLDDGTVDFIKQMFEKLYEWNGIGLAAPQVGVSKRIVVVDIRSNPRVSHTLINPKIIWKSEEIIKSREGCLSLPLLHGVVMRHKSVSVEYLDETFVPRTIKETTGLLACCLQHEIDHLDGYLYVDRMSKLGRHRAIKRFEKLLKERDEMSVDGAINE